MFNKIEQNSTIEHLYENILKISNFNDENDVLKID